MSIFVVSEDLALAVIGPFESRVAAEAHIAAEEALGYSGSLRIADVVCSPQMSLIAVAGLEIPSAA